MSVVVIFSLFIFPKLVTLLRLNHRAVRFIFIFHAHSRVCSLHYGNVWYLPILPLETTLLHYVYKSQRKDRIRFHQKISTYAPDKVCGTVGTEYD